MAIGGDKRAGALQILPASQMIGLAEKISPAVMDFADAFRKGQITADDIHDRFGSRGIAEDKAKIATAEQTTKEIGATGDLQIKAKQAMLSPEMVGLEVQAKRGSLEDQIKTQQTKKESADVIAKAEKLKYGQLLNDAMLGIPSAGLEQEAMAFPGYLKIEKDPNTGVISNIEEVKAGIGRIQAHKNAMAAVQKFTDLIDPKPQKQTFQDKAGNTVTVEQPIFKGSMQPVPKEDLQALWEFQKRGGIALPSPEVQQTLQKQFGAPGQVTAPTGQPQAPAAPSGMATSSFPAPAEETPAIGTTLPSGGTVVGIERNTSARPTEVESRANKFSERMMMAETQYTTLLQKGVDPSSTTLQVENSILSSGAGRTPVMGPIISSKISPEAKEYHQIVQAFTSGMLRDESGAAIRDEERAEYERMLFPVAGDPKNVIDNKARIRAGAISALKQVANRQMDPNSYEKYIEDVTGKQFPAATSVKGSGPSAPPGAPPATTQPPVGKLTPADIPTIKPGQDPPPGTRFFRFEGENEVRQVR